MIDIQKMITQAKATKQAKIDAYKTAKNHLQESIDQITDSKIETILKPAISKIINQVYLYNDDDNRFVNKNTYLSFQNILEKLLSPAPVQNYYHATDELNKLIHTSKITQNQQANYTEIIQLLAQRFTKYVNHYELPIKFNTTENKLEVTLDTNSLWHERIFTEYTHEERTEN